MDSQDRRTRTRRRWFAAAVAAAVWSYTVLRTGGIGIELGWFRLTSMNHRRPAVIALIAFAVAWWLAAPGARWRTMARDWDDLAGRLWRGLGSLQARGVLAPIVAALAAVSVVAVAFIRGAFVAGGSDSYGYVSQAHLWATGTLKIHEPLTQTLKWPFVLDAFAPLGYSAVHGEGIIVPTYAPGYPMTMAVLERAIGPHAAFWVVPILAGLGVWATYWMGKHVAGRSAGVAAAAVLATSPIYLSQSMVPMSDVPVAAWWALVLGVVPFRSRAAAVAGGLAAAMAILTRPNLVPLLLPPLAYLAFEARRERALFGPAGQRLLLFGIAALPAFAVVAGLNAFWYGSPWRSGYGTISGIYHLEYFWGNVVRYPAWLFQSETPFILLVFAAPFVLKGMFGGPESGGPKRSALHDLTERPVFRPAVAGRPEGRPLQQESGDVAVLYASFAFVTFACYALYIPFDSWAYLRFLMPAIPPLAVLVGVVLAALAARLAPNGRVLTLAILVLLVGSARLGFARDNAVFVRRGGERQYQVIGEYVADRLPANTILLAMQHSGSARFYSGRLTVRYDMIPGTELEAVLADLRKAGYHPYILVYDWEHEQFLERFGKHSRLARLDWPAVAIMRKPSMLRIFDPADVETPGMRQPRETDIIP